MIPRTHPFFLWRDLFALARACGADTLHERCVQRIRDISGLKHVVLFPFARSALHTVFTALGIVGKSIVVPAYTCKVVAEAVLLSGNTATFCDVAKDNWLLNLDALSGGASGHAAVVPTLVYGTPITDHQRYRRLAESGTLIVEDAAMAFGSQDLLSRRIANSCTIFSFNIGKTLSCVEGGALATNNTALYEAVKGFVHREFSRAGISYEALILAKFVTVVAGYNGLLYPLLWKLKNSRAIMKHVVHDTQIKISESTFRKRLLSRIQLHILDTQLDKFHHEQHLRKQAFGMLAHALKGTVGIEMPAHLGDYASCFPILVARGKKDAFKAALLAAGVETYPAWDYALTRLPEYDLASGPQPSCPVGEELADRIVCLPFYAHLTPPRAADVVQACRMAAMEALL